jgi:hypothetical protein
VTVLAADTWRTNGHLIADMAVLGYLKADDHVLDPTFGRGLWWTVWQPKALTVHDLRLDGTDFRNLPYDPGTFDAAVYDPPYVSVGGRKTTTIPELHDRFGLTDAPTTPAGVQQLINDGLTEVARVVKPRSNILVKCQDYVSSGKLWPGTHLTLNHAFTLNLDLVDRLEHVGRPRPQPPGRRQVHARRNLSTLLVLRSPK